MAAVECPQCSARVPAEARFCPRCGRAMGADSARRESKNTTTTAAAAPGPPVPGPLPSSSRMPLAGIFFLVAAVLGPTMIAVGVSLGSPLLVVAGVGIAVLLIVLLLLGMVF